MDEERGAAPAIGLLRIARACTAFDQLALAESGVFLSARSALRNINRWYRVFFQRHVELQRKVLSVSGFLLSSIVTAISAAGYGGVVGLMALESACIPLPSEIIMPFSGFLVSTGRFNLFIVATAGAIGCNVGSTVAYLLGAYGGRKAVLRWGHYVFFGAGEVDRLDWFFSRYGSAAVLIGRLLPVVRTFISLPAGIANMSFVRFEIYTFIGSWPWCFALAYIGMILGEQWKNNPTLRAVFHQFDWVIAVAVMAALAYYIYDRWRSIHKHN